MAKQVFKTLRGINTVTAPTRLREGEFQFMQNVRGRPFFNLAKRRGIAPVSSSANPIYFIGDFEMDEITIPMQWDVIGLTFFPPTVQPGGPFPEPSPYPNPNPLDPGGTRVVNFPIEGMMRAINERAARIGSTGVTFPNSLYDASGNSQNIPPTQTLLLNYWGGSGGGSFITMPANGFYATDLAWYDLKNNQPQGTRAAQLVNLIRTGVSNVMGSYAQTIDGHINVNPYDAASIGLPAAATISTYNTVKAQLRACISLLKRIWVQGILVGDTAVADTQTIDIDWDGYDISGSYPPVSNATAQALVVACIQSYGGQAVTGWNTQQEYGGTEQLYFSCSQVTGTPSPTYWGFCGVGIYTKFSPQDYPVGLQECSLINERGKFHADLSNYVTGSVSAFTSMRRPYGAGNFRQDITPNPSGITGAIEFVYYKWKDAGTLNVGSVQTTNYLTGTDVMPTFNGVTTAQQVDGWQVLDYGFQITFTFDNP